LRINIKLRIIKKFENVFLKKKIIRVFEKILLKYLFKARKHGFTSSVRYARVQSVRPTAKW
jgi:hypothetical protein